MWVTMYWLLKRWYTQRLIVHRVSNKNVYVKCSAHDAGISGIYFNRYARSQMIVNANDLSLWEQVHVDQRA